MSSNTNEIKEKLDIVEVVGSYIKLEKAGQNYKARCPFHQEKTPSFFVSPKRNSFYCFGCGVKGDIFSFVEQFEGIDFLGALKLLAERAGIQLKYDSKENKDERDRLFSCIDRASVFFENELKQNKLATDYLLNRSLKPEMIKEWRLGFAPDDWHKTEEELARYGFTRNEMLDTGVIKRGESDKIYDTFRNRIMFPIFDGAGRVVAFSGRILGTEEGVAKYLNSPETKIFRKSEILYGYHIAKNGIRRLGFAILVEGQMDLLMAHQVGWDNVVATSGTAFTEGHLSILRRLSQNLVIAYDSDEAGIKAAGRAAKLALMSGFNVKMLKVEGGKDPADLIAVNPDAWKKALKEAAHIVSFSWKNLIDKKLPSEKFVARFRMEILPLLASIPSDGEKARLISEHKMALATGIREEHILEEIHKILPEENVSAATSSPQNFAPESAPSRRLFGALYAVQSKVVNELEAGELQEKLKNILGASFDELSAKYGKEKDRLIFEAEVIFGDKIDLNEVRELLLVLEEEVLKNQLIVKMKALEKAENEKNDKEIKQSLKECQEITAKLSKVKDLHYGEKESNGGQGASP